MHTIHELNFILHSVTIASKLCVTRFLNPQSTLLRSFVTMHYNQITLIVDYVLVVIVYVQAGLAINDNYSM